MIFFTPSCIQNADQKKSRKKGRRMTKNIDWATVARNKKPRMITLKNAVAATQKPGFFVADFHTYDLFHDFDTNRDMRIPAISLFWATKLSIRSPQRILYPDFSPNHQSLLFTEKMQNPKLFRNLLQCQKFCRACCDT